MHIKFLNIVSVLLIIGCATNTIFPIHSSFDENEVTWSKAKGKNSIKGQAFLRTRGGDIKTCAGFDVLLHPHSTYGAERIKAIYGNENAGFQIRTNVQPPDPKYFNLKRVTKCNATGDFEFHDLPDGTYYIIAAVVWEVPNSYPGKQGGGVMQKVSVNGGETITVQLTGR